MLIRRAMGDDSDALTDLAHRAKAHWGYPASWMREWDPQLTIIPGYLEMHDVWVAERDGVIARASVMLTFDPEWQPQTSIQNRYSAEQLRPGQGLVLKVPLRYTGASVPATRASSSRALNGLTT